jgi:hypothetical protein
MSQQSTSEYSISEQLQLVVKSLFSHFYEENSLDFYDLNIFIQHLQKEKFINEGNPKFHFCYDHSYEKESILKNLFSFNMIAHVVRTGSNSGGSYHENSKTSYEKFDVSPPNDTLLDYICDILTPTISHKQYKEIRDSVIYKMNFQDNQYYGNFDDYDISYIDIKKLVSQLLDDNIVLDIENASNHQPTKKIKQKLK